MMLSTHAQTSTVTPDASPLTELRRRGRVHELQGQSARLKERMRIAVDFGGDK